MESQKETFVGYNKRESDLQYANALIGSASGTGRVSVGDAWEAPIPDLRISGESEQVSTTGAQLLQDSNIYPGFLTNANGTRTNDNNYRTVWLSLPIGTYTLSVPGGVMIVKTVIDGILNNSSTSIADGAGYTCTLTQDGFLGISFRKQDSLDYTTEPQVMLNTGSTAKPWEPYTGGQPSPSPDYPQEIVGTDVTAVTVLGDDNQSKTATIQLTAPLHGIGEYRDRITMTKRIDRCVELIFDGSEDWRVRSWSRPTTSGFYALGGLPEKMRARPGLCNQGTVTPGETEGVINQIWLGSSPTYGSVDLYVMNNSFYNPDIEDKGLAAWKAHLASHPLKIVTYLDTPVETDLPAATQTALNALTTFTGTTHITITAGGPEPDVAVEYVQDTKAVIADLQAQINAIRNGGTT